MSYRQVTIAIILLVVGVATTATGYDRTPIGTWEWSEYQEDADSHTYPADVGYTAQRMFLEDGTYLEFRDEVLVTSGTFTYGEVEIDDHGPTITIITLTIDGTEESFAYNVFPEDVLTIYYGNLGPWPDYPVDRFARRTAVIATEQSTWAGVKLLFR